MNSRRSSVSPDNRRELTPKEWFYARRKFPSLAREATAEIMETSDGRWWVGVTAFFLLQPSYETREEAVAAAVARVLRGEVKGIR